MSLSTRPLPKRTVEVGGKTISYTELGDADADPVVFLHGNPTSSYLWRNVMPHVSERRCLAPDLIGMGDSAKLDDSGPERYTLAEHRDYLDGWFDALGLGARGRITLVLHDWGSALGFDWARRHPQAVSGIAYMEAIVRPMRWQEWPQPIRELFQGFRSSAGEKMVLEKNIFVERVLPGSVLRELSDAEMDVYRQPFLNAGEDRRPTLTWPRQIPLDGEPADVVETVQSYADWLAQNESLPKLFINAEPGAILTGPMRDFCRGWPNQQEVTVSGSHFIQEDSPDDIGRAIADWLNRR